MVDALGRACGDGNDHRIRIGPEGSEGDMVRPHLFDRLPDKAGLLVCHDNGAALAARQKFVALIAEEADFRAFRKRQHPVVLQQGHAACGQIVRRRDRFLTVEVLDPRFPHLDDVNDRAEVAIARLVQHLLAEPTVRHRLQDWRYASGAGHINVIARLERLDLIINRAPVGHDITLVAPLLFQHISQ